MQILLPESSVNLVGRMRSLGYRVVRGRRLTFARRLDGRPFPRFHVYARRLDCQAGGPARPAAGFLLHLHLDQTPTVHRGATAHQGEYEGRLVAEEGRRVKEAFAEKSPA